METTTSSENGALTYADGNPHDRIQFFDAKLILKPDMFANVRASSRSATSLRGKRESQRRYVFTVRLVEKAAADS